MVDRSGYYIRMFEWNECEKNDIRFIFNFLLLTLSLSMLQLLQNTNVKIFFTLYYGACTRSNNMNDALLLWISADTCFFWFMIFMHASYMMVSLTLLHTHTHTHHVMNYKLVLIHQSILYHHHRDFYIKLFLLIVIYHSPLWFSLISLLYVMMMLMMIRMEFWTSCQEQTIIKHNISVVMTDWYHYYYMFASWEQIYFSGHHNSFLSFSSLYAILSLSLWKIKHKKCSFQRQTNCSQ